MRRRTEADSGVSSDGGPRSERGAWTVGAGRERRAAFVELGVRRVGRREQAGTVIDFSESAGGGVVFRVRVQPRASKDEIAGAIEGALKVRLRAPATENRANESLIAFLATLLKTPKPAVRILAGERSRVKRVEVVGVTRNQILDLLRKEV